MVSSLSAYSCRRSHLYPAIILIPYSFHNNGVFQTRHEVAPHSIVVLEQHHY